MSHFTPKTEEEIDADMVLEKGSYSFEVVKADMKESKSGNMMLVIDLQIYDSMGREQYVRDWLVASEHPLPLRKLRHYCRAVGAMDAYDSGDLNNFPGVGACGRCEIGVQDSKEFGPQNRVVDYLSDADEDSQDYSQQDEPPEQEPMGVPASQAKRAQAASDDDEIPF